MLPWDDVLKGTQNIVLSDVKLGSHAQGNTETLHEKSHFFFKMSCHTKGRMVFICFLGIGVIEEKK